MTVPPREGPMQAPTSEAAVERVLGLCRVPARELDRRFRTSDAGRVPQGPVVGAMMALPGTPLARPIARLVRALAWQGKVFEPERGEVVNRILAFRIKAVRARVYRAASWLDGRPCIVLDYAPTSLLAAAVRDELREIEPGLWLGLAYLGRTRILRFALAGEGDAGGSR
jgi:hypothetical protein